MEEIKSFYHKGGSITWIEGEGAAATHKGEPKKFLVSEDRVYRVSEKEWENPPEGFIKAKGFL